MVLLTNKSLIYVIYIDKLWTGNTEQRHLSLYSTLPDPAKFCLHFKVGTLLETWVHYEDLILHFCKVSKPLELVTF